MIARGHYRPSNRFSWTGLPVLFGGAVLAAALAALILQLLFSKGWYIVIMVPIFVSLFLAGAVAGLIWISHFRNRWLALIVGGATGLGAYLGYYYLSIVMLTGIWMNPVNLPAIVQFRMQTDVTRDVGRARDQKKNPLPSSNWLAFIIESIMITGIPASMAFTVARRAYCEQLKVWYTQETKTVPPGYGMAIVEGLDSGALDGLLSSMPAANPQNCDSLVLESVQSAAARPLDYPIYLSVQVGNKSMRRAISQMELTREDALALLPLFSSAASRVSATDTEVAERLGLVEQARAAEILQHYDVTDVATVTPVAEPYRKLMLGKDYKWKLTLVGLIPLYLLIGGAGMCALGMSYIHWGAGPFEPNPLGLAVGLNILGAMSIAAGLYAVLMLLGVCETIWTNRRFRGLIQRRPGVPSWALMPTAELVALIPREAFLKIGLTITDDVLLVKLDEQSRTLCMVGDCNNYTIPVDAILELEPVAFYLPGDAHKANQIWCSRLLVSFGNGVRELLLMQAHLNLSPSTNSARRLKEERFCSRVAALKN